MFVIPPQYMMEKTKLLIYIHSYIYDTYMTFPPSLYIYVYISLSISLSIYIFVLDMQYYMLNSCRYRVLVLVATSV